METYRDLARRAEKIARLLGNPHRMALMVELCRGERSHAALSRVVDIGASALAQHLALLKAEGVVNVRREEREAIYVLASPEMQRIVEVLVAEFSHPPQSRPPGDAA